jgi:predicted kinase
MDIVMREPFEEFVKRELDRKTVLIACGLPASGKTGAAEIIAGIKGFKILSSDIIRREVFKDEDIFDEKLASSMDKRMLVYDEMFRRAGDMAEKGEAIILDATFITQYLRRRAAAIAAKNGMTLVIQQTQCPKEICLERIAKRSRENYTSNAITEQAYMNNLKSFEKVDLEDLKTLYPNLGILHLLVDTSSAVAEKWAVISKTIR